VTGPSPAPAPVGMRSRASGAARLDASFCRFCERALALSELRLFRCPVFPFALSLDVQRQIARERVPVATASVNQIGKPKAVAWQPPAKVRRSFAHARAGDLLVVGNDLPPALELARHAFRRVDEQHLDVEDGLLSSRGFRDRNRPGTRRICSQACSGPWSVKGTLFDLTGRYSKLT
jgi:hypothetical protein